MRMIVFFDLPVVESQDRYEYNLFRKYLVKNGFLMMQESVYCKLLQNATHAFSVSESIKRNKPPKGLIQILMITEKQFSRIEYVLGEKTTDIIDNDERLLVF